MNDRSLVWFPLRKDGFIPQWGFLKPRVFRLPDLGEVIPPRGSAFGRYGRGWIANAPLSLHLKQKVFDSLPTLLPEFSAPEALLDAQGWDTLVEGIVETPEDGCIDVSRFSFVPEYYDAFVFCVLGSDQDQQMEIQVPVLGPYGVGLNGTWVLRKKGPFGYVEPEWISIPVRLQKGNNPVCLFSQMIGWRESRIVLGMRILSSSTESLSSLRVGVPVHGGNPFSWLEQRQLLNELGVRRFCIPDRKIPLWFSSGLIANRIDRMELVVSLSNGKSSIEGSKSLAETPVWTVQIRDMLRVPQNNSLRDKGDEERKVILEPDSNFLQSLKRHSPHIPLEIRARIHDVPHSERVLGRVYIPRHSFAEVPYGDYLSRKQEALQALSEIEEEPFGVLAALALGKRDGIGSFVLKTCIDFLNERRDCADFYALALLVALYRFGEKRRGGRTSESQFPRSLKRKEQESIQEALLGFKYWHDEPGVDAMCWFTENHQIIFHTAGYLAGALFPDARFRSSGILGRELAERCARRIRAWILPRLQGGYSEWDSNTYLAMDMYALIALVEYAPSQKIRRLAETLLDKTFFMIACQSIRGAHGCSHGRCYTEGLKTARVESTSGLQRIGWGMGGFNGETWATGMLALAERYRVHPLIQEIGGELTSLLETRSCSYGKYSLKRDLRQGRWEVHTLSRRTRHYLLSAALDHRPGEPGIQEHLWQLTFSPEAVLFSTWPGNSQEHGNARPNYWAGSARLPRVAMEGRSLLCLYDPSGTTGLGFGHAYCPRDAFDEVVERESWIFVRSRKGYGALRSDGPLYWIRTGPHAYQELRSGGGGKVFLAVAGSEDEDGDFFTFQKKCMGTHPTIREDWVGWNTLDGHTLEFSWQGPLQVDGKEKSLRFPWHYQNRYTITPLCSPTMVITKGDETLTLDLSL
ncbi:MAG: hypothetical protein N2442_06905 [Spirochaetes bacterium]|nr:hypothetical protein [Spirochaetota bacterium]